MTKIELKNNRIKLIADNGKVLYDVTMGDEYTYSEMIVKADKVADIVEIDAE